MKSVVQYQYLMMMMLGFPNKLLVSINRPL